MSAFLLVMNGIFQSVTGRPQRCSEKWDPLLTVLQGLPPAKTPPVPPDPLSWRRTEMKIQRPMPESSALEQYCVLALLFYVTVRSHVHFCKDQGTDRTWVLSAGNWILCLKITTEENMSGTDGERPWSFTSFWKYPYSL